MVHHTIAYKDRLYIIEKGNDFIVSNESKKMC